VIKERSRAIGSTLLFKSMPNRVIVELINVVILWINAFPPSSGVSKTYSPRTIMTGSILDYVKHCKLPVGAYVETHEENTPTNTMKERTRAAICLGPTANFQGSYKFLCLRTGRRITRKQFQEMPMPASVIKAMEALTERDKKDGNLDFTDRDRNPYKNLEDDTNQLMDVDAGVNNEDLEGPTDGTMDTEKTEEVNDNEAPQEDDAAEEAEDKEAPCIQMEHPGDMWAPDIVPDETTGVAEATTLKIPGAKDELPGVQDKLPGVQGELTGVPPPEDADTSNDENDEPRHYYQETRTVMMKTATTRTIMPGTRNP
jgi:hypothetical protein